MGKERRYTRESPCTLALPAYKKAEGFLYPSASDLKIFYPRTS